MAKLDLKRWGIEDQPYVDPAEVLLRAVAQAAYRVQIYSMLLAEVYESEDAEKPDRELDRAMWRQSKIAHLIGYRWGVDRNGNKFPVERVVDALVELEGIERDRLVKFSAAAVNAGLAERQVRIAEQQSALFVAAIQGMMADLELTPEQQARAGEIVSRRLREIADGNVIQGELAT